MGLQKILSFVRSCSSVKTRKIIFLEVNLVKVFWAFVIFYQKVASFVEQKRAALFSRVGKFFEEWLQSKEITLEGFQRK